MIRALAVACLALAGCGAYEALPLPWAPGTTQEYAWNTRAVVHVNTQAETARLCGTAAPGVAACTIWREPGDPQGELRFGELVIPAGVDCAVYVYPLWGLLNHEIAHCLFGAWHP